MKSKNIILSLLFMTQAIFAEKICEKPLACQLYKECAKRYKAELVIKNSVMKKLGNPFIQNKAQQVPNIFITPNDEVTDAVRLDEVKKIAALVSFRDEHGNLVQPQANPKREGFYLLPFTKTNAQCVDFMLARNIIEKHDKAELDYEVGSLLEEFQELMQLNPAEKLEALEATRYCAPCAPQQKNK